MTDRDELRRTLIERIRRYDRKSEESEIIVTMIENSSEWKEASVILAFFPLSTEPDISRLLRDERVLLPYIENDTMKFSRSRHFSRSGLGFMEPEHIEEEYEDAMMLVPLLGFNGNYRLGRGGGYYDRYICENRSRLYTAGAAFSVSFAPEFIPIEHDERLDRIFTPLP